MQDGAIALRGRFVAREGGWFEQFRDSRDNRSTQTWSKVWGEISSDNLVALPGAGYWGLRALPSLSAVVAD